MMWLQRSKLNRWLIDFVPLLIWMALIFWLSSRTVLVEIEHETGEKFLFKISHMVAYGVLAWLWWRALTPQRHLSWSILLMAFALTTLYGISDEVHQLFVPRRHGQFADVLFDASGALAMILLIRRVKLLRTFPSRFILIFQEKLS